MSCIQKEARISAHTFIRHSTLQRLFLLQKWQNDKIGTISKMNIVRKIRLFLGFYVPKHRYDYEICRDGELWKFRPSWVFNEHRRRTVYMAQHFASNQMQPPRPGFDHAAFRSSAECHFGGALMTNEWHSSSGFTRTEQKNGEQNTAEHALSPFVTMV